VSSSGYSNGDGYGNGDGDGYGDGYGDGDGGGDDGYGYGDGYGNGYGYGGGGGYGDGGDDGYGDGSSANTFIFEAAQAFEAWHYLPADMRTMDFGEGRKSVAVGETLTHRGDLRVCFEGLHASLSPEHAAEYKTTAGRMALHRPVKTRVLCWGRVEFSHNKFACTHRKLIEVSVDRGSATEYIQRVPTTLNRAAYKKLIDEDLVWLAANSPNTLERRHIEHIIKDSLNQHYATNTRIVSAEGATACDHEAGFDEHCDECAEEATTL